MKKKYLIAIILLSLIFIILFIIVGNKKSVIGKWRAIETDNEYPPEIEITALELDSRKVSNGGLFIALSGKTQDGKKYIPAALDAGARVVVYDGEYNGAKDEAVFIKLKGDYSLLPHI